jgi:hypothetical protein
MSDLGYKGRNIPGVRLERPVATCHLKLPCFLAPCLAMESLFTFCFDFDIAIYQLRLSFAKEPL